jgi:aminoglycoside/choline kinase family phosphotransferase
MYTLHQLNSIFTTLFQQAFNEEVMSVSPLPASGSQRQYFRVKGKKKTALAAYNPQVEENRTFIYYAGHFAKLGLNVPEILAVNDTGDCYLQTDLGNLSLFDLVQKSWEQGSFHESLLTYYRDALSHLVYFQIKGHQKLDYNKAWPEPAFDLQAILNDLLYFKYYFLKLHPIPFNESRLQLEFENLTAFISKAPSNYFMYRDFQSRNIMVFDGKPFYIDFQGGKQGPLQYDLVSLLYQVKARIPDAFRAELKAHYLNELSKCIDVESIQFDRYYPAFVYLRLMQVLGAYGYRGLIQKKPHFIESIPYALNEIKNLLKNLPLPSGYCELRQVLEAVVALAGNYPLPLEKKTGKLLIQVNSFSYKKGGMPYDQSGNGGGFAFDCRSLPNPGRIDHYKMLSGRDKEVVDFLASKKEVADFLDDVHNILSRTTENYLERGFSDLMVNFGCTGGQHRSVFCAEKTAAFLRKKYPQAVVRLSHIELFKSK